MGVKVTYLLGAGASFYSVPIVQNLSQCLRGMAKKFSNVKDNQSGELPDKICESIVQNKDFVEQLIVAFINLADKHEEYTTIDTYAKYLYLMEKKTEYDNLKKYLSIFFFLHQNHFFSFFSNKDGTIYNELDKRYLTFMISIMSKKEFPKNVKILSWNYDYQFQKTLEQINFWLGDYRQDSSGVKHTSFTDFTFWPYLNSRLENPISLYHLNGLSGFYKEPNEDIVDSIYNFRSNDPSFDDDLFLRLTNISSGYSPVFEFAWERKEIFEDLGIIHGRDNTKYKNDLIDHISNSEILVLIGYSFPFFNREVDRQIFEYFKTGDKKTIYYQNLHDDKEKLYEQFDLDRDKFDIRFYDNVDNFLIPNEY